MAPENEAFLKRYQENIGKLEPITFEVGPIRPEDISAFKKATLTAHVSSVPPTFCTVLRKAEFEWLDRMKVDMRNLLHTEQQYQYLEPIEVGQTLQVTTSIEEWKERRGMIFTTLLSEVKAAGKVRVRSSTTFVLRNLTPETK
jgi:hypothetical protein